MTKSEIDLIKWAEKRINGKIRDQYLSENELNLRRFVEKIENEKH